tara:strand:+ start:3785 stop:4489 length:705 start_codon:yes stop_codon:yes gene_type:complete
MINLVIGEGENEIKCNIPNCWSEITIAQYSKIISILESYKLDEPAQSLVGKDLEEFEKQKKYNNVRINTEILRYLTGLDMTIVKSINMKQAENMIGMMTELLQTKIDYSMKEGERDFFEFKGIKYNFPLAYMRDTTFGDYIESEQVAVANAKIENNRFGAFAEQMAILCKQDGVENTEEVIQKKTRLFANLPMDIAWKFVFFLSKQMSILKKSSESYLKLETETLTGMQQKIGI